MAAAQLFSEFTNRFEQPLRTFVEGSVDTLTGSIAGPMRVALTLYVVLYGFAVIRGAVREPVLDFAWRSVRVVTVYVLATNAGSYQSYVYELFFTTLPNEITSALSIGGTAAGRALDSGALFDRFMNKGIEVGYRVWSEAGTFDVGAIVVAAIIFLSTIVSAFLQYAIVLYAKVGLGVVIALGPVFIALLLFEATRPFGEAWTRQLANFIVLHVLVVALVGLMLTTVETFVDQYGRGAGTTGQAITNSLAVCAIMGLCAFAALQLPEIAGGLAGGGATLSARALTRAAGQIQVAAAQRSGAAAAHGRELAGRAAALARSRRAGGSLQPAE